MSALADDTNEQRTRRVPIPEPRDLPMPPDGYQPSKEEQEEEIDMPGMSEQQLRDTFFRPFRVVRPPK